MASLKCMFCGYGIHYHGEPEGLKSIEHYFCTEDKWRELEANKDMTTYSFEWKLVNDSWKCARCGSFSVFKDDYVTVSRVYVPKDEFSSELMQEPFEFGPFWDDHLWFNIMEDDIPVSEIMTKYPQNLWLAKNEDEMRLYADEARTKCVAQFRRLHPVFPVTVQTMSLKAFKKMLATYDGEIDFFYRDKLGYEIIKEPLVGGQLKIIVNHDFDNPRCIYSATVAEGENFVDDLIKAKILPDGKSIAEAQAEVKL